MVMMSCDGSRWYLSMIVEMCDRYTVSSDAMTMKTSFVPAVDMHAAGTALTPTTLVRDLVFCSFVLIRDNFMRQQIMEHRNVFSDC